MLGAAQWSALKAIETHKKQYEILRLAGCFHCSVFPAKNIKQQETYTVKNKHGLLFLVLKIGFIDNILSLGIEVMQ